MSAQNDIKSLVEGLATKNAGLLSNMKQMRTDVDNFGAVSTETKTNIDRLLTEQANMERELKSLRNLVEGNAYGDGGPNNFSQKTFADLFLDSDGFKNLRGVHSGKVDVKSFLRKDITSAAASAGPGLPQPTRTPMVVAPKIGLTIRDLINVAPIATQALEYVKYTFTNNAAVVYDGTTTPATREGVTKPKSDLVMTKATATAETIAHWVAASEQVLKDMAGLRNIINTELMYGLKYVEEQEILTGSGAGHLNGIYTQAQAFDTDIPAGTTFIDMIRAGILQVRQALYAADAIVVSPLDWYNIETTKDENGRYIIGDPTGTIGKRLWGLPVVESDSMSPGTWLVGAFGIGATLYDLEQASIETRDTHADFFVKNMVAIRAEERVMLVVTRPAGFVKGTFS